MSAPILTAPIYFKENDGYQRNSIQSLFLYTKASHLGKKLPLPQLLTGPKKKSYCQIWPRQGRTVLQTSGVLRNVCEILVLWAKDGHHNITRKPRVIIQTARRPCHYVTFHSSGVFDGIKNFIVIKDFSLVMKKGKLGIKLQSHKNKIIMECFL